MIDASKAEETHFKTDTFRIRFLQARRINSILWNSSLFQAISWLLDNTLKLDPNINGISELWMEEMRSPRDKSNLSRNLA